MAVLFGLTLFVSAALLFWVQPMTGKMLLPFLGGVPSVWNICMVFFQTMLLAGYAYAHFITRGLNRRGQAALHLVLLGLGGLFLPLWVSENRVQSLSPESHPALWLLGCLGMGVGLPFFILSSTTPLVQLWFSNTRHAAARDPYFLYSASNLGSLIALVGYPVLIEPHLRLQVQSQAWAWGYGSLGVLVAACAVLAVRRSGATTRQAPVEQEVDRIPVNKTRSEPRTPDSGLRTPSPELRTPRGPSDVDPSVPQALTVGRRFRWVLLAFVPSSLMLGATTYLTTDIASIPLLWVIPLAIYLLTFVCAFAPKTIVPWRWTARLLPIGGAALTFLILSRATQPIGLLILLHLVFLFVAAMTCHGRLAKDRPAATRLTEFYLWISLGGVLGGLFNALLAPSVFTSVAEYPLAIVLACLLRAPLKAAPHPGPFHEPNVQRSTFNSQRSTRGFAGRWALHVERWALRVRRFMVPRRAPRRMETFHELGTWDAPLSLSPSPQPSKPSIDAPGWREGKGEGSRQMPGCEQPLMDTPPKTVVSRRQETLSSTPQLWLDLAFPVLLGGLTVGLVAFCYAMEVTSTALRNAMVIGLPVIVGFCFVDRPVRFGLGLGAILLAGGAFPAVRGETLFRERDFFGVSRVTRSSTGAFHYLIHGNTLHGRQFTDPTRQCEPLAYYHRTGPLGDIFKQYDHAPASTNVAVIGLGTGSMMSYARPGQSWTFYEVDPCVIRIARNPNLFTYLRDCAAASSQIIVGDARLRLREAPARQYGLIVLDAFSSDAIPVHLLTREAIRLYCSKLAAGGLLAFHISNRYLELEPVIGDLAKEARLVCRSRDDWNVDAQELAEGKEQSQWAVLARREEDLGLLLKTSSWLPVEARASPDLWTDDFSNILGVFKWK